VEIMVHTTAPSRGQDDARYRHMARAYLDFEAVTSQVLGESPRDVTADEDELVSSQLQQDFLRSTQEERESQVSYRPESDSPRVSRESFESAIPSPQLSFDSVLDNADSPSFRRTSHVHQLTPDIQRRRHQAPQSSEEHPSVIQDSQPENDGTILKLSSPTKAFQLLLQRLDGLDESYLSESRSALHKADQSSSQPQSTSPEELPTKSTMPMSTTMKNMMPSSQHAGPSKRKYPETRAEYVQVSSSAPSSGIQSSVVTSTHSTISRKRQHTGSGLVETVTRSKTVTSSTSTMIPKSSPACTESVWTAKSEIQAPLPKASTKELTPEMLITPALHELALKMPLSTLFRPQEQTRDLRPMERGYWLVKCQNLTEELRSKCWDSLGNFVGGGMAGWGVQCFRDKDFETIRVYCWGAAAKHIYLLLWMASKGNVNKTGPCWIGGDSSVIIKFPS
jgi:hypothetical protein